MRFKSKREKPGSNRTRRREALLCRSRPLDASLLAPTEKHSSSSRPTRSGDRVHVKRHHKTRTPAGTEIKQNTSRRYAQVMLQLQEWSGAPRRGMHLSTDDNEQEVGHNRVRGVRKFSGGETRETKSTIAVVINNTFISGAAIKMALFHLGGWWC